MTPIRFTTFVRPLVKLTPGQRAIALVAFDGVDPIDLPEAERELARAAFGEVDVVPAGSREVFAAVCGARAGKSYVLCALRLLHLSLTVSLDSLAPGEVASALIVAPDLRLGRQTLRYALGAAKTLPAIARLVTDESSDSFTLRREAGRSVTIECLPATRGGSAVRGRSLVGAVLDECAFFRDADYTVNDLEVFRAIAPRIVPGGQLILASTPWAEAGLLYELYRDCWGDPGAAIVAHAPTLLLRPDARTRGIVERERLRDEDNARREFDAEFTTGGSGLFLDPAAVEACVDDTLILPCAPRVRGRSVAGADFGFRSDSSAIAVVEPQDGNVVLLTLEEERPKRGAPLRPSAVASTFAELAKSFLCTEITADSHYAESIREHLRESGLRLVMAPAGADGKTTTYLALRELVNGGRLRLPRHARLLAQLKALTARPTSGGGLQISSPRRAGGGHGDLVSALVCAIWRAKRAARPQTTSGCFRSFNIEDMRLDGTYERNESQWPNPTLSQQLAPTVRY